MSTEMSFNLTSTAVEATKDGEYSYAEAGLLVPHEALRREFIRGENAFKSFDLLTHPWKIHCFNEWYQKFFLPTIKEHHDLEEKIFFPFFLKLGSVTPHKQSEDHKEILIRVSSISLLSKELVGLIMEKEKITENTELIREKTLKLQTEFHELIVHTNEHLADEELFWPKVLLQHGQVR